MGDFGLSGLLGPWYVVTQPFEEDHFPAAEGAADRYAGAPNRDARTNCDSTPLTSRTYGLIETFSGKSDMKRREFLRYSGAGLAAAAYTASGASSALAGPCQSSGGCPTTSGQIRLTILDRVVEMIDGVEVRVLAFKPQSLSSIAHVPGPVLRVREGDLVSIAVTNDRPEPHGFEIGGIPASKIATIACGETKCVTFTAPVGGTYMYFDPSHPSQHLYRLLGLHGTFIVHPRDGMTRIAGATPSLTPYSMDKLALVVPQAATSIGLLFNAFGTTTRFPGTATANRGKWVPCALDQPYSIQERIWLFSEVDPRFNALIRDDGIAASTMTATAASVIANWVPRYFTINGKSGFDLSEGEVAETVVFKNYIGEPSLIRTMCAGLAHHATHIHGNHIIELSQSYLLPAASRLTFPVGNHRFGALGEVVVNDDLWERDVWPTAPMQIRDVMLPFEVPPDIPNWTARANGTANEPWPLRYVMHDHCEMGTTAAGGNYPQGAVTHWEILGPLGGRAVASSASSGSSSAG